MTTTGIKAVIIKQQEGFFMRRATQILAALAAAAVCAFMTYLTFGSGQMTVVYNVSVLAIMLVIILFAAIWGFHRMSQTVAGLNRAAKKLISVYQNKTDMAEITKPGAEIFEVTYLDHKYQEYLAYLRKTNSPCDIGDYIGEYEINNYTHRRLVEMVPDVLTSLGILGTFIGLVIGLRGFNPVSYEAMASSITSLIDGIKVAFVTSIYGISLSLAYTYWERGALTNVSECLDNFLDKYYLCAVTPTDATAMNHVLANQRAQTRALEGMGENISNQIAATMADHMDPVMMQINGTLEHFTDAVTMQQQELLDNMAKQVTGAMKKEMFTEFAEMRALLRETNTVQKQYVQYISEAQKTFENNLRTGSREMAAAIEQSADQQKNAMTELQLQQQHLTEFVDYMSQAMKSMTAVTQQNERMLDALTRQVENMEKISRQSAESAKASRDAARSADAAAERAEQPVQRTHIDDIDELTDRLDAMIDLLEKQQRQQAAQAKNAKRGFFR